MKFVSVLMAALAPWCAPLLMGAPQEPVRVGVSFNIPLAYLTAEGEPAGFFVEVFREAARRENVDLKILVVRTSPDRFLESGEGGIWTAAVGTAERRRKFHVTEPWWILDTYMATMESSGIRSQHDVSGKRVLLAGTPPFTVPLSEFLPGAITQTVSSVTARFEALCAGRADAVLFYETDVHRQLGLPEFQECRERGLRIIAFDRPVRQLSMMATPQYKALAERLQARIELMKRDGTMERMPSFRMTGNDLWQAQLEEERRRKETQLWQVGLLCVALLLAGATLAYVRLRAAHKKVRESLEMARESVQAKREFLATMSHEIRTPMTAVLGYMDLMQTTPLRADQRWFAQEVTHATTSLLAMLTDVLSYSRSAAGISPPLREPFDVVHVIDDCVAAVQLQAEAKGLNLVSRLGGEVPDRLMGDGGRVRQMVLNLLTNAVKFTQRGFVEVRTEYTANGNGGVLRITVSDTGVGIPAGKQNGIFLPFTQVDSTHTRTQGGIGLGLAIVNTICTQMGGTIRLESKEGEGAAFTLELPMERAAGASGWIAGPGPSGAGTALTLWEEGPQVKVVEEYLVLAGYALERTGSIAELLQAARQVEAKAGRLLMMIGGGHCTDSGVAAIEDWKRTRKCDHAVIVMAGSLECLRNCSDGAKSLPDVYLSMPAPGRAVWDILRFASPSETPEEVNLGLTVLVVDDNAVNRRVLNGLLERLGCRADTVDNGAEAIERAKRADYSLILMDCQMPVVNGFEATQRIRREVNGNVPIWGVSAALGAEIEQECLDSGMNDFMAKPVSLEALKRKLQRLCEANQARQ